MNDKLLHFVFWYAGTLTIALKSIPIAIISMVLLGIAKECYDKWVKKKEFCFGDLGADFLGIGAAIMVIMVVSL